MQIYPASALELVEAKQGVQTAVPVNLDFGTLREIVDGLHRAWGEAQGYAYCPGSEPYREARRRAMSMHAGALRYIESMESYAAPAYPAEGVPDEILDALGMTGGEVDDVVARIQNISAERHDAEEAHAALAATQQGLDAVRAEFESFSKFSKCEWSLEWDAAGFYTDIKADSAFLWFQHGYQRAQAKQGGEA